MLASFPLSRSLFAISVVARLPLPMLSIGLLVHTEQATGEYAAAGVVAAAFALAQGVAGPLLGRVVDRRGQTVVLAVSALVCACALLATSALWSGAPVALRVALAVVAGAALPPVGACVRALLGSLVAGDDTRGPDSDAAATPAVGDDGQRALRAAYATESAAVELMWVLGPPLVLALAAAVSTGAALAATGVLLAVATLAFAASRPSRCWRPVPVAERHAGGALRAPAIKTLAAVLLAAGLVIGAVEVAVAAAADDFGRASAAGPLLALWGIGSLLGGLATAKLGGGARTGTGLVALLAGLAAGHIALAAAGSVPALGALILLAGTMIAPTFATVYAMVDSVAPQGTATEAFAWLATAAAVGASAGAAGAGATVDAAGPAAAFGAAGLAALLAALIAVARVRTLPGAPPELTHAAPHLDR